MTVNFKTFRAEINNFLSAMSEGGNFRTTGDCSIHPTTKHPEKD